MFSTRLTRRSTAGISFGPLGEFQYPKQLGFEGADLCQHTATVESYGLPGDDFVIIGGYESGVDAAFHLSCNDKRARLIDSGCPWDDESSDPSVALSTYSIERMREEWFESQVELLPNCEVSAVKQQGDSYVVCTSDGREFKTPAHAAACHRLRGQPKARMMRYLWSETMGFQS